MLSDQLQRERALDISHSFIVQAPAGSGKTELLTQRFIKLLLSPALKNPEEVIAITFTRKAAAQMRARILSQLNDIDPQRLRIMTIDAFCGFLNRQMPLESRLGENFTLAETPDYLYEKAIENLFLNNTHTQINFSQKALINFLIYIDNDMARAKNLLTEILKSRDQWLPHMPAMMHENAVFQLEKAWQFSGFNYSPDQKKFILGLSEVLILLQAELQQVFIKTQTYDFIEMTLRALEALGNEEAPTELSLKLDYQIQHILIDEFQDTSITQWRLLQKLTLGWEPGHDGRTLFLVGDPMQSIYRFRKAEVGLFLHVQKYGVNNIYPELLILKTNFRSSNNLIKWFNQSFSKIFPQESDLRTGAVSYTAAESKPEKNSLLVSESGQSVFYYGIDSNQENETNIILKIISENPQKNIGILVRSRGHLKNILPALQKNHIAFRAAEIAFLADHALIEDLYALTRALYHPADRIAWLAILRASWCGLTLIDLHELAAHDHESAIEDLLLTHKFSNPDAQRRVQSLLKVFKWALDNRGKLFLREWIEQTWLKLQGPNCLSQADFLNELKIAEQYFDLLDEIQHIKDIPKKLLTTPLSFQTITPVKSCLAANYIDIMTIHKAKGLEFDIVILPALEKYTRPDQSRLFLWEETLTSSSETALLVAPMPERNKKSEIYDYLKQSESARSSYELQRLFYVAATRAKQSLHLLFSVNLKSPAKNSFLNLLWPLISDQYKLQDKLKTQKKEIKKDYLKRLPLDAFE